MEFLLGISVVEFQIWNLLNMRDKLLSYKKIKLTTSDTYVEISVEI
jgi:hypothetical protein